MRKIKPNPFWRIDHIYRHIQAINVELGRVFPRKRIIQREMLQIVIRLTDQLEEIIDKDIE